MTEKQTYGTAITDKQKWLNYKHLNSHGGPLVKVQYR